MNNESQKIDRKTASAINPMISESFADDTLDRTAQALYELATLVDCSGQPAENLFNVFGVIVAALRWESKTLLKERRPEIE